MRLGGSDGPCAGGVNLRDMARHGIASQGPPGGMSAWAAGAEGSPGGMPGWADGSAFSHRLEYTPKTSSGHLGLRGSMLSYAFNTNCSVFVALC